MKKKLLTLSAISTIFVLALGVVVVSSNKQHATAVEAEQHAANYSEFKYSGSYYNSVDINSLTFGMSGTLKSTISSLVHPKGTVSYSSLDSHLQDADEDPTNSSNMVYFYARDSVTKNSSSVWNKEHVWPRSKGNFQYSGAGADILHIRPTYQTTNSARGSYMMGNTDHSTALTYNGMNYGYKVNSIFEPMDTVKGDVARIFMYLWTTYSGLTITNVIKDYNTLLQWHYMDKPDELERVRNDYSEKSNQKNRNPFVDHPEYAWMIFGDAPNLSQSIKQTCMDTYPADGSQPKTLTGITITGEATKKKYIAGESFDPTGLTITGNYDDGSTINIVATNCIWSPNPLIAGTTAVTCTYNGKTAIYSGITVDPPHEHTFSNEYTFDETYHWYAATCGHDVVSGKERHSFEDVVTPATEEAGGYTTHVCKVCGYTYRDGETQPLSLIRIRAIDNKAETGYQIGEELDITVTAEYNDGSSAIVTDYTVEGFNNQKPGEQSVLVTYTHGTITKGNIIPVTVLPGEGGDPDPEQPEEPDDKEKRGCVGSITASLSITAFSTLIGLIFVFKKRR